MHSRRPAESRARAARRRPSFTLNLNGVKPWAPFGDPPVEGQREAEREVAKAAQGEDAAPEPARPPAKPPIP